MDLPHFAVVRQNVELDYWEILSMTDLQRYEQAKQSFDRHKSLGDVYLVAVTFIAGPTTDLSI